MPRRLYEITTETGMPHLENNLRYADTREKRCLSQQDLATAFRFCNIIRYRDASSTTKIAMAIR